MTLTTGGRSKERVLLYGMEAVGKSLAALDIAARVHPSKVFIIDNDNAWDRMLEGATLDGVEVAVEAEWRWDTKAGKFDWDGEWVREGGNVTVFHVEGWEANETALEDIREHAGPHDWCVIDSGSALWDDVQAWFTDKVFGQSKASYFMQARLAIEKADKEQSSLGALDGWMDWPVINAAYKEAVMTFLVTPPCHLLVTCEEAQVSTLQVKGKQVEDADTRQMYGGLHVKPRGQKRIGHNVQTVIQLSRDASGKFKARTVKDRGGRERLVGEDVTGYGFGAWYLEEVAGWVEGDVKAPAPSPVKKVAPMAKQIVAKG